MGVESMPAKIYTKEGFPFQKGSGYEARENELTLYVRGDLANAVADALEQITHEIIFCNCVQKASIDSAWAALKDFREHKEISS